MTNEQNFKKGDKVRYIGKYPCYVKTDISKDETYTVREINGDMCLVDVPSEGAICVNDLELVESLDRRTAFLTRLQSLLREFDAKIYDNDYYRVYIDLGIHGDGVENIVYSDTNGEVTADNIMDFDKEGVFPPLSTTLNI